MNEWKSSKLGELSSVNIGGTPSRTVEKYWAKTGQEDGVSWVAISDMKRRFIETTKEFITPLGANNSNVKLVKAGTLMMSFKLSLGKMAFASKNLYTNEAIASFEIDESKIDKVFLYYQLSETVKSAITDTAIKGVTLNKEKLNTLLIRHPSLQKQRGIAAILSSIDDQIDTTQTLIDKYTLIKQGMMADLFSRGIDTSTGQLRPSFEEAPELYHKTDLGWLPKGWDALPLSELSTIASGITMGKDLTGVKTVTVPYLRVANVQDGYLDLSEVKTVKVPADEAGKYVLQYGDVLMNEGGDFDKLGRGTVWRNEINECSHQNHVFRVRVQESKLRSEYLAYWSASSFGKKYFILNSKQSTNLASINSTQLKAFPIATPSSTEQLEIEIRVKSVDNMISAYQSELNKLTLQKQGLMQDLLTGKVSIK